MISKPVFIGKDESGNPRLEAANTLASKLHGRGWITPQQLKESYKIPDNIWKKVRRQIARSYRDIVHPDRTEAELHGQVNLTLSRKYALMFPWYGRSSDLAQIHKILQGDPVVIGEIGAIMHDLVMRPRTRARMLTGLFMKIAAFSEFAHIIDASYFSYMRGNFIASYYTIIPVVEGFLLRWRGHNSLSTMAPPMAQAAQHVRKTPQRNPLLTRPLFADSWADACSYILEHHFYRNTQTGHAFDNFNRHIPLHGLADVSVYSPDNLMRVYLLLDNLARLYLCEHWIPDPIMALRQEEEAPHANAYLRAVTEQLADVGNRPEEILWTHERSDPKLLANSKSR